MITIENLKNVLSEIGFEKSDIGDYYKIDYTGCSMAVDFDNAKLIYPEKKGLVVNDRTTSNFSHPENFVVFECVCRLLEKGYRPEHIELEPRWTLGHDAKGGKADKTRITILCLLLSAKPLALNSTKKRRIQRKTEASFLVIGSKKAQQDGWRFMLPISRMTS